MASGNGGRELATQGRERPLGESASTRDVTKMRRRVPSPLGTGRIAVQSASAQETASTPPPCPETSKLCRKVYSSAESSTGGTLGPTRAMIDLRKQRIRQNRTTKLQALNDARKEMRRLEADVGQLFTDLESTLLTHPAHPNVLVQTCSDEFNDRSV